MKFRKSTNNKQLFHMFFDEAHGFKSFFVILIYIYIYMVSQLMSTKLLCHYVFDFLETHVWFFFSGAFRR